MKISYPHVFQDSGNEAEAGYVLNIAFVRLLRSLASGYHTFYDENEQRVTLQDSEVQLIEQGIKGLTIEMALPAVVLRATLPVPFVALTGVETIIDWRGDFVDATYATFVNSILTLQPGKYLVLISYRIDNTSTAVNWFYRMKIKNSPSTHLRVFEGLYGEYVNHVPTATNVAILENPEPIWWAFEQFSGGMRGIRSQTTDTRLEVLRLG